MRGGGRESLDGRRVGWWRWRWLGAGGTRDAGGDAGMTTKALRLHGGGRGGAGRRDGTGRVCSWGGGELDHLKTGQCLSVRAGVLVSCGVAWGRGDRCW